MIPGDPPASTETSLERIARAVRSLFEGGVGGPATGGATDNRVPRWDGTDGRTIQNSLMSIDDSGNVTGVVGLTASGVVNRTGQPAFSAHKNGTDQTGIANGTFTKIEFGTEIFDVGGFYDASTHLWTPPAGKIMICAALFWSAGVANGNFIVSVFKNATGTTGTTGRFKDSVMTNAGAAAWGNFVSIIDDANGNDTYQIRGFGGTAGTLTVSGAASATYFMGYML